jgi:Fe2+ or Zn2+ uptake regulation protein
MRQIVTSCQDKADRASVYRTISIFEKLGIVQRLQSGWKYKLELSNAFTKHHHHLTCSKCGIIIPLNKDNILEDRLHNLALELGFVPNDHQIEITGLCRSCARDTISS